MTANTFSDQVMFDTSKRTIIRLSGEFDFANSETANTKVQGRNLRGALARDTNNAVLLTAPGAIARTNYDYSVSRIWGNVYVPNGYIRIEFDGANSKSRIIDLSTGTSDFDTQDTMGSINNTANGANGNIIFSVVGAGANSSYTIMMELFKGADFDKGQAVSPADFNFGRYSVKP